MMIDPRCNEALVARIFPNTLLLIAFTRGKIRPSRVSTMHLGKLTTGRISRLKVVQTVRSQTGTVSTLTLHLAQSQISSVTSCKLKLRLMLLGVLLLETGLIPRCAHHRPPTMGSCLISLREVTRGIFSRTDRMHGMRGESQIRLVQ